MTSKGRKKRNDAAYGYLVAFGLADSILRVMKQRGISKSQLAALHGVNPSTVTRWLAPNRNLTVFTAAKIARSLGAELEINVTPEEERHEPSTEDHREGDPERGFAGGRSQKPRKRRSLEVTNERSPAESCQPHKALQRAETRLQMSTSIQSCTAHSTVAAGTKITSVRAPNAPLSIAKERDVWIRCALKEAFPYLEIPTDLKVEFSYTPYEIGNNELGRFDLPIAISMLIGAGIPIRQDRADEFVIVGNLTMEGIVSHVFGGLVAAEFAKNVGCKGIIVPKGCGAEASMIGDIEVHEVANLQQAVEFLLSGTGAITRRKSSGFAIRPLNRTENDVLDFADVRGYSAAKSALEQAVADGHSVLLRGSAGTGKTMLARRIPSIMPPMTAEEAITVSKVWSAAGMLSESWPFVYDRPFRAPHHTISAKGLKGDGRNCPGEIALAHNGVLFLDEVSEFDQDDIEAVFAAVSKKSDTRWPSDCMVVGTMQSCPCGASENRCNCSEETKELFRKRTEKLVSMFDMVIDLPEYGYHELSNLPQGESSETIRERVEGLRQTRIRKDEVKQIETSTLSELISTMTKGSKE